MWGPGFPERFFSFQIWFGLEIWIARKCPSPSVPVRGCNALALVARQTYVDTPPPPSPPLLNPLTPPAAAKPWHRFDYFARKEDKRWFDHFAGTKQKEEDLELAKMSNYLQSSWGQTRAWNLHLRRSKFKIATYLALGAWMKCSFKNSTIILSSLMGESTYDEKDFSNFSRNI